MTPQKSRELNPLVVLGFCAVLLGLVVVFYTLWQEQTLGIPGAHGGAPGGLDRLGSTALHLLEKLGLTLIVFGMLDLLLHLPSLNRHFLDTMRDLIIEDSYLRRLRPETLTDLVNRAIQARLGDPEVNVDREGSFLHFFNANISDFISKPYRENAKTQIICMAVDEEYFHVKDIVTYVCRKFGKTIQENVRWINDPNEVSEVKKVSIWVQVPGKSKIEIANKSRFKFRYVGDGQLYDKAQENSALEALVLEESLASYAECDGLIVTIESEYTVRRTNFQYWQMSHLTKGMDLTLKFPENLEAQVVAFFQDEEKCIRTSEPGYYRISYPQWVLPDSGVCWRFMDRQCLCEDATG